MEKSVEVVEVVEVEDDDSDSESYEDCRSFILEPCGSLEIIELQDDGETTRSSCSYYDPGSCPVVISNPGPITNISDISGPAFINTPINMKMKNCAEGMKVILSEQIVNYITEFSLSSDAQDRLRDVSYAAVDEMFNIWEAAELMKETEEERRRMIEEFLTNTKEKTDDFLDFVKRIDWIRIEKEFTDIMRSIRGDVVTVVQNEAGIVKGIKSLVDKNAHGQVGELLVKSIEHFEEPILKTVELIENWFVTMGWTDTTRNRTTTS